MFKILSKLNGWQRLFAVFFTFIYLPIVALVGFDSYIEPVNGKIITKKVSAELKIRHLNSEVEVIDKKNYDSPVDKRDYTYGDIIEELSNRGQGKVYEFSGEGYDWEYRAYFSKTDIKTNEIEEIANLIQNTIDSEYKKLAYISHIKTIFVSLLIAIGVYIFGMSIGWVASGFKKG
jgi:hypothetical protein